MNKKKLEKALEIKCLILYFIGNGFTPKELVDSDFEFRQLFIFRSNAFRNIILIKLMPRGVIKFKLFGNSKYTSDVDQMRCIQTYKSII
ncbi:hypothetical protein BpHYR1_041604 [Brachionus plicatilis]|uniref:Uncharacterized protein n=1 Tax=Brachionus plicatilis TaxID=10195 RepID=A0A3M7QCH9_BRAPC|nr:hypothetical protein BpHYR1_041604 [Brachionus plicatilis]